MMKFMFQETKYGSKICYLRLWGLGIIAGVSMFFYNFGEINGTNGKETLLGHSPKQLILMQQNRLQKGS